MVQPEFEEKQFEDCHKEILCVDNDGTDNDAKIYSVGQYLEHTLGVDTRALLPPHHPLWNVMGSRYPSGVSLDPDSMSSRCVNIFIQYKRATYHPPPRSQYYYHFQNNPYYGFKVNPPRGQLDTLLDLTDNVEERHRGLAVVRYVAPRFHTQEELWNFRDDRTILQKSAYVPPTRFRPGGRNHNSCYYSADVTVDAIFNSEPEAIPIESYEKFMGRLNRIRRTYPRESIPALSRTIRYYVDYKSSRYTDALSQLSFPTREFSNLEIIADVLAIASFAYLNNLQWLIYADS